MVPCIWKLALIDGDVARRAQITRMLSLAGRHIEPYDTVREWIDNPPQPWLLLLHDDGAALSALLSHLGDSGAWAPIVAFSEDPSLKAVVRAISAGILDYLAWPSDAVQLIQAIRDAEAKAGRVAIFRRKEAKARRLIAQLTKREREVLSGITDGYTGRVIGERLEISPRTVEIHRANMLQKIGAKSMSEAIGIWMHASLLDELRQINTE